MSYVSVCCCLYCNGVARCVVSLCLFVVVCVLCVVVCIVCGLSLRRCDCFLFGWVVCAELRCVACVLRCGVFVISELFWYGHVCYVLYGTARFCSVMLCYGMLCYVMLCDVLLSRVYCYVL